MPFLDYDILSSPEIISLEAESIEFELFINISQPNSLKPMLK
jgi:hypothetical protein